MHDTDTFKKNIHEDYDIEEELGSGQFAVVRKIIEKETGDEFAAKYVRKKRTKASRNGMSREDIKREIEILRMVDSEKIIKVHDVYETEKEMILIMELLRGGELFDYISKKDFLTEEEAIDFTRQILLALQHLHSRSVVHLDLKPENILLKNTRRKTIKLVDFGLARVVNENEQVREIMGTPEFVAPEILNFDTISTATDMWALGVIAYILLSGASPFLGEDNQETFTNIIQVDYQFDEEYFAEISDEAKDFIRKLLVKNPRKRPTAHDCSRHPWVEEEVVDKKKRQRRRTTQICTFNFKRFVARKRWKMSYNKIRAMNLIAKMGIKPPPGFVSEIPPMLENDMNAEKEHDEKPSSHKDHKKNTTINRRKHKQPNSPKSPVEKTDSLTLKTMDIDIGEGASAAPEPEPEPESKPNPEPERSDEIEAYEEVGPSSSVEEPVDYGSMTMRQKRRARGQLRRDEIAKSKKEIDAKQSKVETDDVVNGNLNDEDVPVMEMDVNAPAAEKPAETESVTSTMRIEHKPASKTPSGGILKKRDAKCARIPSTEDHYFVTLNAALFQQEDAFYQNVAQPPQHGILKHTNSAGVKATNSEVKPVSSDEGSKASSERSPKTAEGSLETSAIESTKDESNSNAGSEKKVTSEFTTVVEVLSGGISPPKMNFPVNANEMTVDITVKKAATHAPEKEPPDKLKQTEQKIEPKSVSPNQQTAETKKIAPTSQPKKSLPKNDNHFQQRGFTPPPWKQKSSSDNLKTTPRPLQGVSKVSLKANRFLSNDKQSKPKSPTGPSPRTSGVLGKTKFGQKELSSDAHKPDIKKAAATKSNSHGMELRNVACDINLDDSPPAKEKETEKTRVGNDESYQEKNTRVNNNSNNLRDEGNVTSRSRSNSAQKLTDSSGVDDKYESISSISASNKSDEKAVLTNDESIDTAKLGKRTVDVSDYLTQSTIENLPSTNHVEQESGADLVTSSSTHSLSELTIRPLGNSSNEKAGGFGVVLTIAPPNQQHAQEPRALSSLKSRHTASSSSLPNPRSVVANGKLTSLSTSDVTSHDREAVALTPADRGTAQASKYTPHRDFSKYLSSESPKSTKTSTAPANTPKSPTSNWQHPFKRNPPSMTTTKTTINPKTPTKSLSLTAMNAGVKLSVAPTNVSKGKTAVTATAYIPRRTFGFPKPASQSDTVVKTSEPDEPPKVNNSDQSKRWSQSSYTSERSASSASSDESSLSHVTAEIIEVNCDEGSNGQIRILGSKNSGISKKIENHSGQGNSSPRASPVLERKWKATLLLPKDSEKVPSSKDRDVRISSTNAPRKNKFSNVRSMWEGK